MSKAVKVRLTKLKETADNEQKAQESPRRLKPAKP